MTISYNSTFINMIQCPQIEVGSSTLSHIGTNTSNGIPISLFSFVSPYDYEASQITVRDLTLVNCSAKFFSIDDISSTSLTLTLTNLNFTGNTVKSAQMGVRVISSYNVTITLQNSLFDQNVYSSGDSMLLDLNFASFLTVNITNNTFTNNQGILLNLGPDKRSTTETMTISLSNNVLTGNNGLTGVALIIRNAVIAFIDN